MNEFENKEFEARLKTMFSDVRPPKSLSPENITERLDAELKKKKRTAIKQISSIAAVFVVLIGGCAALSVYMSGLAVKGDAAPAEATDSVAYDGAESFAMDQKLTLGDTGGISEDEAPGNGETQATGNGTDDEDKKDEEDKDKDKDEDEADDSVE